MKYNILHKIMYKTIKVDNINKNIKIKYKRITKIK
jgi:hypothetical protein